MTTFIRLYLENKQNDKDLKHLSDLSSGNIS